MIQRQNNLHKYIKIYTMERLKLIVRHYHKIKR